MKYRKNLTRVLMCGNKKRQDKLEAMRLANIMAKKYNEQFNPYECKFCGFWHIGRIKS